MRKRTACPLCAQPVGVFNPWTDDAGRWWHPECARRVLAIMPDRKPGDRIEAAAAVTR